MEPELNCSSQCDSARCLIEAGVGREDGLDVLQRLCSLSRVSVQQPRRSISPVLSAVVWTLLSCGILSAFCFLFFTMRFKNNRIVKMSSPNLNVLTLLGSVLTYVSGVLFAVDAQTSSLADTSMAVLQARIWTLCVGSTLVFGPILGKTWRLYRVFTQRVPDKRVIIRDIQLIGMVALLVLLDLLVLTAWNLTDPVRCSRSVAAVVKEMERDVFYSLSQLESCSSVHSNIWLVIIAVKKGILLLYGTYLAGLTSNVSRPPVNQSPTIITAVALVTVSSAVAVPVSSFLQAWPNLVCSTVAGAIFLCTLATNCMLFVPQLTQWRQFEEDQNDPSQMAKYFSSPSKSQASAYSQDEVFYLLGENSSMKKLLTEKNAVIDSLQEQVNSAKDKLLRLMTESQPPKEQEVDSSSTYLNSSSTQTTDLQSEGTSSSSLPQRDSKSRPSPPSITAPPSSSNPPSSEPTCAPVSTTPASVLFPHPEDVSGSETRNDVSSEPDAAEDVQQPASFSFPGRTAEETVKFVTSLQTRRGLNPTRVETFAGQNGLKFLTGSNLRPTGFVSSEQLQEILQGLSVDAVMETTLRSPVQASRTPSQVKLSALSPLSPRTPCSPHPPDHFRYPCVSPCMVRKRRPPFYSGRRRLAPPGFYTGPEVRGCRRPTDNCEHQNPEESTLCNTLLHAHSCTPDIENQLEEEEEDANRQEVMRKCQRCLLRCYRCCSGQNRSALGDTEEGGEKDQRHKHIRDSSGYWDSDSSSSTDYCYYHLPYCDSCLQRGSLVDSDSSSDSSDSEYDDYTGLYRPPRPVVFKDDLKPTFV
ncbi:probable G-protein coupled receptor 156 [Cololabis saira]|uniref:probable G-protein coupled receptor 156 n=1 Tax=Cololabis saira TaxID=129043 RepID=UPI002AD3ED2A|nr:probable G-protein coupled receptor 156 [Cololabis saira]